MEGLPAESELAAEAGRVVTELLQLLQPNGEVVAEDGAETILAEAKAEQAEAACMVEAAEVMAAESTLPQPTSAALTEALVVVMLP